MNQRIVKSWLPPIILIIFLLSYLIYSSFATAEPENQNPTEQVVAPKPATSITSQTPSSVQPNEEYCNPSYPDVCIDVWPPDLDCEDIPYRNFTVLYPDQHKFDGDKDGTGCEK